nr:hypothetical protein [Salmonella enterica]WCS70279.1 hypothetical protein [Salmonella enterica subsp. enterica serovar Rissen]
MNNEVIVTARKLTDYEERLMFMPKFFGQYWLLVENHTYKWMRKLSSENKSQYLSSALDKIEAHYDGGEWDFMNFQMVVILWHQTAVNITVFLSRVITLTVC